MTDNNYALAVTDASYEWYLVAAKRSRRAYRRCEAITIALSTAIPIVAAFLPSATLLTAALGSCLMIIAGLRAMFHWQENYLRFSHARESVEGVRRLYRVGAAPYDDPATRDQRLVVAVTQIERDEMRRWTKLAEERVAR
ncbi:DUF4231 domain-containing protein [Micromonospora sp. NPDC005367]|uniref:DUF4231 domain-containing protein n=1 Tax=Micromonospora sp. NPDC005367 TaxID=3155590 RepID=UPI0033AB0962